MSGFMSTPAAATTASTITKMMPVVPLSGWMKMSPKGMPRKTTARRTAVTSSVDCSAKCSSATFAAASASVTFANSEGCSLKGPISTQRVAPLVSLPRKRTASSNRMVNAHTGAKRPPTSRW